MATIGERIDRINQNYDRAIDDMQRERNKEITAVLAESGIGVPGEAAPKRRGRKPGPKPGSKRGAKPGPKPGSKRTTKRSTKKKIVTKEPATGPGRRSRKRLSKVKKAALVDRALQLFNAKPGQKFSRGDLAGKLKVKPTQVQTILKEIKGLKSEGNKATTVYFVT